MEWHDAVVHREIVRVRARYELTLDEFRGLDVSNEQVDRLVEDRLRGRVTGPITDSDAVEKQMSSLLASADSANRTIADQIKSAGTDGGQDPTGTNQQTHPRGTGSTGDQPRTRAPNPPDRLAAQSRCVQQLRIRPRRAMHTPILFHPSPKREHPHHEFSTAS